MLTVGLTGGVGSGKSTAVRRLAQHGAVVVDADMLARSVVAPGTPGFDQVHAAFGDEVFAHDGELDRRALAALVFRDAQARERLEQIVHPLVRAAADGMTAAAPADAIVVHDVPLLVETGRHVDYDVVVVVDAPDDVRLARVMRDRGWDREGALDRMAAQASREERLAVADEVLDNSEGIDELEAQVDALWERLLVASAGPEGSP